MDKLAVDEFVKIRVLPEFQPIVAMIRELMRECAPNAAETISYGIPVYKMKKIFAVISPHKEGITFSFTHGTEFEDKYNLLRGNGEVSRHVKIKNLAKVNKETLSYYIKQALEIEAKIRSELMKKDLIEKSYLAINAHRKKTGMYL